MRPCGRNAPEAARRSAGFEATHHAGDAYSRGRASGWDRFLRRVSPLLDCGIAFGFLDSDVKQGTPCAIDVRGKMEPGMVVNKRFLSTSRGVDLRPTGPPIPDRPARNGHPMLSLVMTLRFSSGRQRVGSLGDLGIGGPRVPVA